MGAWNSPPDHGSPSPPDPPDPASTPTRCAKPTDHGSPPRPVLIVRSRVAGGLIHDDSKNRNKWWRCRCRRGREPSGAGQRLFRATNGRSREARLLLEHAFEQYLTWSQSRSHFFRQEKGRWQTGQIFSGRSRRCLLMPGYSIPSAGRMPPASHRNSAQGSAL